MTFDYVANGRNASAAYAEFKRGWPAVPSCPREQDRRFQRVLAAHFAGVAPDLSVRRAPPAREVAEACPAEPVRRSIPLPKWRVILSEVAAKHRIPERDIIGPSRKRRETTARYEVYWRLNHELGLSLHAIGRRIGQRDHSSVHHGLVQHEARMLREGRAAA
ncbi:helix-turn-helix domain-containing protein [Methylocaldum sp.]|uniref:helix-turn-helix domain-containing protein n=1 Tax=Methylocaldum sp. TaxID=1969727 RepID=UPI002D7587BA|nr:helix-turn-helix domain-containing protein [Methylocaldum sp.]HYE38208.1 helix-turn-helix domain-containing protein [Methylocaldum sp.]